MRASPEKTLAPQVWVPSLGFFSPMFHSASRTTGTRITVMSTRVMPSPSELSAYQAPMALIQW